MAVDSFCLNLNPVTDRDNGQHRQTSGGFLPYSVHVGISYVQYSVQYSTTVPGTAVL